MLTLLQGYHAMTIEKLSYVFVVLESKVIKKPQNFGA